MCEFIAHKKRKALTLQQRVLFDMELVLRADCKRNRISFVFFLSLVLPSLLLPPPAGRRLTPPHSETLNDSTER